MNELEDLALCLWKKMSKDPNSSTFQDVKDTNHKLYKCYDCLGIGMNVCEYYAPIKDLKKIKGDYR